MSEAEDQVPDDSFNMYTPSSMVSPIQEQKTGSKSLKLHFAETNSTTVANSSTEVKNETSNLTLVAKNETKVSNRTNSTNATIQKQVIFKNTLNPFDQKFESVLNQSQMDPIKYQQLHTKNKTVNVTANTSKNANGT